MLPEEDEAPQSDHSVELVTEVALPFPTRRRRIAQVVVIAVMMSAGGLIGLALTEHHRALDEERALERAQGTQLKDGWKTFGLLAAEEARAMDAKKAAAQPAAAPTAAPTPTPVPAAMPGPTNVLIVNPPAATQRRSPGIAAPAVPAVALPTPAVGTDNNGSNTVYVPAPALPDVAGTNIPEPNLSNGSGSLPNPALPNGAASGMREIPGQPNGPNTPAPSAPTTSAEPPTGSVPASPPESGVTP